MALPVLITTSGAFARKVEKEIEKQLFSLKRGEIAKASLDGRGAILVVKDLQQAIELANRIAPEHLEVCLSHPVPSLKKIKNAGAVFLGLHTPEAIGDYLAGPNHILPTAGTARFSSPLGVEDFIKRMNWMHFTKEALKDFEKDVKRFAEWEGLEGHYRAVQVRLKR
jgi:histidinol dehydrogenase